VGGAIALVGSGEFTPATEAVDVTLLEGRPARVVFLPTAAAPEGAETLEHWVGLGTGHYRRLGVDAVPLMVLTREDADDPTLANQVGGAGLIYLSGGNPTYLARTVAGTRVGAAIRDAWEAGCAVAGCSAGAIALTETVPDIRRRGGESVPGLGLVAGLSVIPHFDQVERWMPGAIQWAMAATPAGVHLVGIDEDTAMVGGPVRWRVMGAGSAWLLDSGTPVAHGDGTELVLDVPPAGSPF
jgi:cyanophycinase-like exopeptidase